MFKTAKLLLLNHHLCDNCLGRQFALLGYGLSNKERGIIIKNASILEFFDRISKEEEITEIVKNLAVLGNELAINSLKKKKIEIPEQISTCELCGNLFGEIEITVDKVLAKLEKEEYKSFLVGAKMPSLLIEKEDQLKAKYQITTGESIKEEFTREIGKAIFDNTKKKVDFNLPEITILIDLIKDEISLQKRSLYIYGRYKKYVRTIPQTKWPCWECNSKGCEKCNFTGKLYQESVEELIANPIMKIVGGSDSKFHGAGREDINALMLGNGRPFVIEIQNPEIRNVNLKHIKKKVNRSARKKVSITDLKIVDKKKIQEMKGSSTKTKKTYRAIIELDKITDKKDLENLEDQLKMVKIHQKTPQRVRHRRSDLKRIRTVYDIKVKKIDEKLLEAEITGEGGLYIKELISGDDSRTKPSFSSILQCNALCVKLDVIKVHIDN